MDLGEFYMNGMNYPEHLVFGLDIGTRSLVGTVGFKQNENDFKVVAQYIIEHETRAMLDGQIHDIPKVAHSIAEIKRNLESQIDRKLTDVCIAAAGRVLKTMTVRADYEFPAEVVVKDEDIHSLETMGVEKAYSAMKEDLGEEVSNFYCVGYTAIRYYLNDYMILNLEGHKGTKISVELLATFLPDEVIDGLYSAVERAGLQVVNLTLEPIAAINVAIPEKFRLLNIALVDVGAGTSDISITKDGSIVAYGMIPYAGDEITEVLVQKYLVDFNTADQIKIQAMQNKFITYKDIIGIPHDIPSDEVIEAAAEAINKITKSVAEKIIELNGGKSVSAVFVVGGGGKIPGFISSLAQYLSLPEERVALRGEEVLGAVEFLQPDIKKDPLLVTPIGICLNYYDQKNNFIFVNVNKERVKLYDNNKLTIVDAAIQVGFPNEKLFPRRGKEIEFTINDIKRKIRGELGEAAVIMQNGRTVGINAKVESNDTIEIKDSTIGSDAKLNIGQLPEYSGTIEFSFNEKRIVCPKFVTVNGNTVSELYNICNGDSVQILNYYTLAQVLEFMDIAYNGHIEVNNVIAPLDEKVYDKFSITYELKEIEYDRGYNKEKQLEKQSAVPPVTKNSVDIIVSVNGSVVKLSGKEKYIFVDILDYYAFDTSVAKGTDIVTTINGEKAQFTDNINEKDIIEIYWKG